jgi:hypothetical protein
MSAKRKRTVVSLETKLQAINRLDKGETIKKMASDLGVGEVTDEMMVEAVNLEAEESESDNEGIEIENEKISHSEGCKAIEKAIEYLEQQSETTSTDLLLLRRLRETAAKKRAGSIKQKTIMDFFKK